VDKGSSIVMNACPYELLTSACSDGESTTSCGLQDWKGVLSGVHEISNVFFTPHHGQVASLITTTQRQCVLILLLLESNKNATMKSKATMESR
jgi:hypothetical protein